MRLDHQTERTVYKSFEIPPYQEFLLDSLSGNLYTTAEALSCQLAISAFQELGGTVS